MLGRLTKVSKWIILYETRNCDRLPIVGRVGNGYAFCAGGQANGFSQFKIDSICLPLFPNCGSFSIEPCRPLPHAKLSGTNLKIGSYHVNFSA